MIISRHWLALVADFYCPLLLIACLAIIVVEWRRNIKLPALQLLFVAIAAYSMMFIDKFLGIWAAHQLDFSTHAAVSLGMVLFIGWRTNAQTHWYWKIFTLISYLGYCALMYMLSYHSIADMVTTSLFMSVAYLGIFYTARAKIN